jgi:hypothetical protein
MMAKRWAGRFFWFVAGGITFAVGSFALSIYRDEIDPSVTIDVANSLGQPAHVRIVGYSQTYDFGTVGSDATINRKLTIGQLGEGPLWIVFDTSTHHEYQLGYIFTGKGPYERFIRLTPKGPVAFFYAPAKGSWCGLLEESTGPSVDTQPAQSVR